MRPRDRQNRIGDLISARGRVSVDELVEEFSASAETIRRDLTFLAANGKIRKIHGGAIAARDFGEGRFAQRMQQNGAAKRHIANQAAALVSPGDTLFIDTGSTTLVLAEALAGIDELTVVTNSTEIARVISAGSSNLQMYLLGGKYNEDNRQTCGSMAIAQLGCFRANLALLAVGALAANTGAMDYSDDEAAVARVMIENSDRVAMLVDSSKFGRYAPFVVADLAQLDLLVSETEPPDELAHALVDAGVEVVC